VRQMIRIDFVTRIKGAIILMAPNLARTLKLNFQPDKVTKFFRDFTLSLIDERKCVLNTGSYVKNVDFLQQMLDAMRDDSNAAINGTEEYTDSKSAEKYKEIQV